MSIRCARVLTFAAVYVGSTLAGCTDSSTSSPPDAGQLDASGVDAGGFDATLPDAGGLDSAAVDAGGSDGASESSTADTGGPDGNPGADAGPDVDAGPPGYCDLVDAGTAPDAGTQCNALNPCDAPDVVIENVSGAAPTAQGGAITQGTYHLSQLQSFDGSASGDGGVSPTQKHLRSVFVFGPGTSQLVTLDPTNAVHTQSATYATGSQLTVTPTCPVAAGGAQDYTATNTQVMLYGMDSGGHVTLFTYTIVP